MRPEPLTARAHALLTPYLRDGAIAVDATAGNGHDTCFLANGVGSNGAVFAFDIQQQAVAATRAILETENLLHRCTLINAGHEEMSNLLPAHIKGKINAFVYNLGYLPRADKSITTKTASTIASLEQAKEWLAIGGIISILAYSGHPGGEEEANSVEAWLSRQKELIATEVNPDAPPGSPRLFTAEKA